MDPAAFAATYYHALPSLAAGLRYPYPATTAAAGASATGRGMIFYPQPMTVEPQERPEEAKSPESPQSSGSNSAKRPMDKKLRRQIANSNERRRMQSINQGFHSLRLLMPHLQGEKLSKAAVLQHAAEHIYRLNTERERLLQQNTTLRMMLSKYWNSSDRPDILGENKVNKATSPMNFDDEKAAARELEQIFASQKELESLKMELERERARRRALEERCHHSLDDPATPSDDDDDLDESEGSDADTHRIKRPRMASHSSAPSAALAPREPSPRNNLDIIVRAIRQIEGDAFSRSTTPTCAAQDRNSGTFRPISAGTDSSRVSPVTPVCAS